MDQALYKNYVLLLLYDGDDNESESDDDDDVDDDEDKDDDDLDDVAAAVRAATRNDNGSDGYDNDADADDAIMHRMVFLPMCRVKTCTPRLYINLDRGRTGKVSPAVPGFQLLHWFVFLAC